MAARRPYRMTPARKAAIRKAQIASAKKRKGSGKGKPVSMRRRAVAASGTTKRRATKSSTSNKKRNLRRIAVASAAVGAAAGAGYVYKNRERLVVAKAAEHFAIRSAKQAAKAQGKRLGKAQVRKVRLEERKNHANRSRYRVQEYQAARNLYREVSKAGMNIRPQQEKKIQNWEKALLTVTGNRRSIRPIGNKNSINNKISLNRQQYTYDTYRKDVNARAQHRLNRMQGKKAGFSYKSGKTKRVIAGRVYRMPF